jgi:hypothetical protein
LNSFSLLNLIEAGGFALAASKKTSVAGDSHTNPKVNRKAKVDILNAEQSSTHVC